MVNFLQMVVLHPLWFMKIKFLAKHKQALLLCPLSLNYKLYRNIKAWENRQFSLHKILDLSLSSCIEIQILSPQTSLWKQRITRGLNHLISQVSTSIDLPCPLIKDCSQNVKVLNSSTKTNKLKSKLKKENL